jgi:drug/metabolite transporter, DME family
MTACCQRFKHQRNMPMGVSTTFVLLASVCWGVSGGVGGMLLAAGWDVHVVSFCRGAIGLLFVLVWLLMRPRDSGLANPRLWCWSILAGLGVAGNFSLYFLSIAHGGVAVAATLMYCAPVFVYLVSFALKLERISVLKGTAIVLVMLGIVLLTQVYNIEASVITPLGVGAGLLAGLSYAMFIFGFKYAAPHGSPPAILSIAFTVVVFILVWPTDIDQAMTVWHATDWPLFAALGVFGAGVSFVLYDIGLKYTAPIMASILAMVEPITAALFGVVVLHERLAPPQIAGLGLILVTVTALSLRRR